MLLKSEVFDLVMVGVPFLVANMECGEILYATPAAERMFGCKISGGMVGKNVDELVPQDVREKHSKHREQYRDSPRPLSTGGAMTMAQGRPLRGVRMDNGQEFPLQIGLVPGQLPSDRSRVVVVVCISL